MVQPPHHPVHRSWSPSLYESVTFLSGFLLFHAQPLIAKYILAWFGGGFGVWMTAMFFFQIACLGGYTYAQCLSTRLPWKRQSLVHLVLLILAIAALPIIPREALRPTDQGDPTWSILVLLGVTVGMPCLLLASTVMLIRRTHVTNTSDRRCFFFLSAGSLIGLLSYPLLVEPVFVLRAQAWFWSAGYLLFVLLYGALLRRSTWDMHSVGLLTTTEKDETTFPSSPSAIARSLAGRRDTPVRRLQVLYWLALPASASALLLATTSELMRDIAAIPLLWVIPTSLYLLTVILSFGHQLYRPRRDIAILAITIVGALYAANTANLAVVWLLVLYCSALCVCCFVLHGELVRVRPEPRNLPAFHFVVLTGVAAGGMFVALVAPVIFTGYAEYRLMLVAIPALILAARAAAVRRAYLEASAPSTKRSPLLASGGITVAGVAVLTAYLLVGDRASNQDVLAQDRNFYGSVRVAGIDNETDGEDMLVMEASRARLGYQFASPERREFPTGYYGPTSGIGVALRASPRPTTRHFSVGVVGLGAGMVVANARANEDWSFYEVNPAVAQYAGRYFSYLRDATTRGAHLDNVLVGDGRAVLERQLAHGGQMQFDVLILDAFIGDVLPVHLLTREAFAVYWRAMNPNGVIAINISDLDIELGSILRNIAKLSSKEAYLIDDGSDDERVPDSTWVLVTSNRAFLDSDEVKAALTRWPDEARAPRIWTDSFNDASTLIRIR